MILDTIVEQKKLQLEKEMSGTSIETWKRMLQRPGLHAPRDFFGALRQEGRVAVIAEVKKASPSKGLIRPDFNPLEIAREYHRLEVQAVSVLTEKNFFLGSEEDLVAIRQAFPLPLLRKDFIIDMRQIYQSRYLGADAILLIASILTKEELHKFQIVAGILGMQCLVEVHDPEEVERALETGARMIGINNRNLKTFEVDLQTTEKLMNYIPGDRLVVSESGISSAADMRYLKELGVNAVLIGETFMRASSIEEKINELRAC